MQGAQAHGVEPQAFRRALGRFATGVAVVMTDTPDGVWGITINSFTSVSLDPPIVLWCLDAKSDRYRMFAEADLWGVGVLRADQDWVSRRFAASGLPPAETDLVERLGPGAPAPAGALAQLACRTLERRSLGDHLVIAGEALALTAGEGDGLTYFCGRYGRASAQGG